MATRLPRHSFAPYHLAAFGDAMKTAILLGHKDPSVVHNHFKALVTKPTALQFWELSPVTADLPSAMVSPSKATK